MVSVATVTAKYALIQMLYWMGHCAVNTYAAVYLNSCGFSSTYIGILLAGVNGFAVFLQGGLASWLDRNAQIPVKKVGALLVTISIIISVMLCMSGATGWEAGLLYALMCIPYTAAQPLLNAMAFVYRDQGYEANYALARACACGAYSMSSLFLGQLVNTYGPGALQRWFWIVAVCVVAGFLWYGPGNHPAVPGSGLQQKTVGGELSFKQFFQRNPGFLLYLLGVSMVFFFHNTQNTYMYSIMEHVGGGSREYGVVFGITSLCEIPASLFFNQIVKKIRCVTLLRLSLIAFLVKGVALLTADTISKVYFAQSLQLFALGLYSVSSVYYAEHLGDPSVRIKAQTLLCDAMFLGACLGILCSGYLLDSAGLSLMLGLAFTVLTAGTVSAIMGITICERRNGGHL